MARLDDCLSQGITFNQETTLCGRSIIRTIQKARDAGYIIEIHYIGESSRRMDYAIKLFKYRSAGVRGYWIVDPLERRVLVYHFEHDTMDICL